MAATIRDIESYKADAASYFSIIRDARQLPVLGLIKRYLVNEYDDFGNTVAAFISSTEYVDEQGQISWTRAELVK